MQAYNVVLQSPVSKSYRCKRAADSLDIDADKKSIHKLSIEADIESNYNVGLILGASGSGKTTLAKQIYGQDCFKTILEDTKPIIEQFPDTYDYETCANILNGVGLTQVPCWIRPVFTLSNGQKARAEAALLMCREDLTIIDEWTSVVDRTVAKVMSHCIQKHARNQNKKIVLLSCHYDVIDWINPDWIIDCNSQKYIDRRLLCKDFKRSEQLSFDIRAVGKESWKYFSKYHYLSENMPTGACYFYGLFHENNQIGFIAYHNYVPHTKKQQSEFQKRIFHANRIVIHPDYAGLGLGILLTNETAKILSKQYRIMCKFSSTPIFKAMSKSNNWALRDISRPVKRIKPGTAIDRGQHYRQKVKIYSFEFIPERI